MPGRPPKPFLAHIAQGTDRARVKTREADKAHLEPGDIGPAPKWMNRTMAEEWDRVKSELPYLAPADRTTVEHHCVLYWRFLQDAKGKSGMTASERNAFHSIQMQLGRTPASRSKVTVPSSKPTANDPWAKFG